MRRMADFGNGQVRPWMVAVCGALLLAASFSQAEAARWRGEDVTGCSRVGHGCVTAPVRPARFGHEVRLPGGTWIGCGGDCRDKLREQTVDFWDELSSGKGGRRR